MKNISLLLLQGLQIKNIMGQLRHGSKIMRTTSKCSSLRWPGSKSTFLRCWGFCGWGLKALRAYSNNLSIKGWRHSLNFQRKYIMTWWRCFSPTWSSKMMCCCQISRVSAWRSTRKLGKMWLDSNQGVCKWGKVKLGMSSLHWLREIWSSCIVLNIMSKWIRSIWFVITYSKPRDSQISSCHMWFWCPNSYSTLELM